MDEIAPFGRRQLSQRASQPVPQTAQEAPQPVVLDPGARERLSLARAAQGVQDGTLSPITAAKIRRAVLRRHLF